MEVTSSSKQRELTAAAVSTIHGRNVEIAEEYKYLGTIFDNTEEKLNTFEVNKNILQTFY